MVLKLTNMKQLSKPQIQELFNFAESHRVRYYDLQTEVVDHLATAIEEKWQTNPNLPFQTALNEVYGSFGIYGFGKLEQEKREAIQWKVARNTWQFVKAYLTIPKIGLTLLLMAMTYQLLAMVANPYIVAKVCLFLMVFIFYAKIYVKRLKMKDLMKKYLEINAVIAGGFPIVTFNVLSVDFLWAEGDLPTFALIFLAVWMVVSLLVTVGTYQYLITTVEEIKVRYSLILD